jgi:hypothetical protein
MIMSVKTGSRVSSWLAGGVFEAGAQGWSADQIFSLREPDWFRARRKRGAMSVLVRRWLDADADALLAESIPGLKELLADSGVVDPAPPRPRRDGGQ